MIYGKELNRVREVPEYALALVERADEEAIMYTLATGQHSDDYIYHFDIDGKPVYGIGVDGAVQIAQFLGNIEMLPGVQCDEQENHYFAVVRGKDLARNITLLGICRQPKFKVAKGGGYTDKIDEHAFTIAIKKAERNCILDLAGHELVSSIIQRFIEQGRVRQLGPSTETKTRGRPPKAVSQPASHNEPVAPPTVASPLTVSHDESHMRAKRQRLVALLVGMDDPFSTQPSLKMDNTQAKEFLAINCDGKTSTKELTLWELELAIRKAEEILQVSEGEAPVGVVKTEELSDQDI